MHETTPQPAEQDPQQIIDQLVNGRPAGGAHEMFANMPSRHENALHDLGQLAAGERGFFGAHLAFGEDGHMMRNPVGTPMTTRQAREHSSPQPRAHNPFDHEQAL